MSLDFTIPGTCVTPGHGVDSLRKDVARLLQQQPLQQHHGHTQYLGGHSPFARFLGAQPVSFCKNHLNTLLNKNFFVCEKTDGIRAILYATFDRQERRYKSYLINRKNDFYLIPALLPLPQSETKAPYLEFHSGTLIDGEIIQDVEYDADGLVKRKTMKFLVFDCLTVCGQLLIDKPYRKRLGYFRQNVLEPLKLMKKERPDLMARLPFVMEQKEMQLSYHIRLIFEQIPNLLHKSDGLIFTSSEDRYRIGTDINILKWKPIEENTVDFALQVDSQLGKFYLFLWNGEKSHQYFSELHVPDPETKLLLESGNGRIIECSWDSDFPGNWKFLRFREDKDTANHVSVFENIMKSIREGVSRDDLLELTQQIRANWKDRDSDMLPNDEY